MIRHAVRTAGGPWLLTVQPEVESSFGYLFGGCALAEAIGCLEELTSRRCLSATGRFLSFAASGTRLDLVGTVERSGSRVSHARVVWNGPKGVVVDVVGAFAPHPEGPGPGGTSGDEAGQGDPVVVGARRPWTTPPERGEDLLATKPGPTAERVELRAARAEVEDEADGGVRWVWARLRSGPVDDAAGLAVLADFLPVLPHVLGRPVFGNTVDLTLRPALSAPVDWLLMELRPISVTHGLGHAEARFWTPEGVCVGSTSQSFVVQSWTT